MDVKLFSAILMQRLRGGGKRKRGDTDESQGPQPKRLRLFEQRVNVQRALEALTTLQSTMNDPSLYEETIEKLTEQQARLSTPASLAAKSSGAYAGISSFLGRADQENLRKVSKTARGETPDCAEGLYDADGHLQLEQLCSGVPPHGCEGVYRELRSRKCPSILVRHSQGVIVMDNMLNVIRSWHVPCWTPYSGGGGFSRDGTQFACAKHNGGPMFIWNVRTGNRVIQIGQRGFAALAFSRDGKWLVTGSWSGSVHIWNAKTGEHEIGPLDGHTDGVKSVAFSPDGNRVVSGSHDRTVRIWDRESGNCVVGPLDATSSVNSVAFNHDESRVVTGSDDGCVRIWNANTGARQQVLSTTSFYNGVVESVGFSPDGSRVVSAKNAQVNIWDAETGMLQTVLHHPLELVGSAGVSRGNVLFVTFSPDGSRVVSVSESKNQEGVVRIWNVATRECLQVRTLHNINPWSIRGVAFLI